MLLQKIVEDMIDEEERRVKSDEIQSLKRRKAVEKDIRLAVSSYFKSAVTNHGHFLYY